MKIKELFGEDTTVRFNSSWENFNPYNQKVSSDSETDEFLMDRTTDDVSDVIDDIEPELGTDEEMDKSEPGESGTVQEEPEEVEEEVTEPDEETVEEVTETVDEEVVEEPVEEEIEQLEEEIEQLEEEIEELKEEDKEDEVE